MIKKLDKLLLKAFLPPFLLTFFVVIFILLCQFMIKYFDDFLGKDLSAQVYAELLFFFTLNMVPVALPISILLSSLMAYGNMGEHNELTAIKSSGISLIRIIMPTMILIMMLTVGAFFFNNDVVPFANLRAYSLLYDIRTKKAALNIKEGTFYYGLPGYVVKVNKKLPDGKTIKDIIVYDHQENRGNVNVTMADSGKMYTILNDRYLILELFRGKNFTENNSSIPKGQELTENAFEKSKLVFSLSSFDLSRTDIELFASNKLMRNLNQLLADKDSVNKEIRQIDTNLSSNIRSFYAYFYRDNFGSEVKKLNVKKLKNQILNQNAAQQAEATQIATNNASNLRNYAATYKERLETLKRDRNIYDVEMHRKYTQSIACLILFLIGAPLGAIIKKGGFGLPVIISIVFFIIFYMLSTTGEKWTKEGLTNPYVGMWYGNSVLFLVGLYFMIQAKNDSNLFNTNYLALVSDRFKSLFGKNKSLKD